MSLLITYRIVPIAVLFTYLPLAAQQQVPIEQSTKNASSKALRTYSVVKPKVESAIIHRDVHRVKPLPKPKPTERRVAPDKAVQRAAVHKFNATVIVKEDGLGDRHDLQVQSEPPDTVGAVGRTQFVQWVNTSIRVFNKQDLTPAAPPALGNSLWTGFGGNCEAFNDGDPVVLYDHVDPNDGRWILSQFAVSGGDPDRGIPYSQCIAVSKTDDALGEYNLYEFQFKNFNDYGKLGTWTDAYYGSFNMFDKNNSFLGSRACAFEREAMREGRSAKMECFDVPEFGGLLPADLDGSTPPPNSAPEYFLNFDFSGNKLNLWKFKASWDGSPSFNGPASIPVADFNLACDSCVTQQGSAAKLNTLGDRLMFRLAYRNSGNRASLVADHPVAAGGVTAIRWYELTVDPSNNPEVKVKQQGFSRCFPPMDFKLSNG